MLSPQNRVRILVADDQADIRDALRLLLKAKATKRKQSPLPPKLSRPSKRANLMPC